MGNLVFQTTAGGQVALVGPNPSSSFSLNVPAVNSTLATLAAQTFAGTQTFSVDASISGLTVGKGGGSVANNTAIGVGALNANTTATNNTAVGKNTLLVSTGADNTALGSLTLASNTTGTDNTSLGYGANNSNTTGAFNTSVGSLASLANVVGNYNTSVGANALYTNTASNNTAVGYQAGYSNTTSNSSTYIGYASGYSSTTGGQNTAIGYQTLYSVAGGAYNTALGLNAGYQCTGSYNTFIGSGSGTGNGSGFAMTTGSKNTILGGYTGNNSGLDIRTASNYIVLSDGDGNPRYYVNGSSTNLHNFVGYGTTNCVTQYYGSNNSTQVGVLSFGASYDQASAGDGLLKVYANGTYASPKLYCVANSNGVYLATGGIAWIANSDERLKENLVPITDAANKVSTLRAVTGNYIADTDKKSRSFLIAQDVQAVLPEAVDASDPEKLGVAYTDVIPLLVAAIQELNAKVTALEAKLGA